MLDFCFKRGAIYVAIENYKVSIAKSSETYEADRPKSPPKRGCIVLQKRLSIKETSPLSQSPCCLLRHGISDPVRGTIRRYPSEQSCVCGLAI